jgi:SnoaL-like domain
MPSREHVEAFVRMVEAGEFVEAMEAYYADDATMQENNEPPRVGLPALIAHERHNIETYGRAKARCLSPPMIDGDRVVIQWEFVFRSTGGAVVRIEELAQQNWRGDRLVTERFFYDPRQMRPAPSAG